MRFRYALFAGIPQSRSQGPSLSAGSSTGKYPPSGAIPHPQVSELLAKDITIRRVSHITM